MNILDNPDVLIIGAGPSGAIAAGILVQQGWRVQIIEREQFPRFVIGESLLPQCMAFIEEAGMLDAVNAAGFQYKDGAAFQRRGEHTVFHFPEKFSPGPGTTFQVQRAVFDQVLADEAERQGARIHYRHEIIAVDVSGERAVVRYRTPEGTEGEIRPRFLLDASGYGRVLPRLLDLHRPSNFPVRQACFTHVKDGIDNPAFDRNKILITTHPEQHDVWYWTIPFSNGTCSLGVVARQEFFADYPEDGNTRLMQIVHEDPYLSELLAKAEIIRPVQQITGYSANVSSLHGPHFALLGNAGEFLDPVFSSGVTVGMKSASLAAGLLNRQLRGDSVDWETEFAIPLKKGVDAFRTFVTGWYDQRFQDIIYHRTHLTHVKSMICSILAGYAWDEKNPYVKESERRVNVLAEICRQDR